MAILTLQPGAAAGKDNQIIGLQPDNNWGIGPNLELLDSYKSIIQFDVSSISAGSTVDDATLSLYCHSASAVASYAHRGLVEWYEGASNGTDPGATDASTWNHRNANSGGEVAWASGAGGAGGTEYVAVATDTIAEMVASQFNDYDVTSDIQLFVDGTTNYGHWLIMLLGGDAGAYYSSNHTTAAQRPKLVINYTEAGNKFIRAPMWGRY